MIIWRPIALFGLTLVLLSCAYGHRSYSTVTTIKSQPRRPPRDRLDFFFGDQKPKSPYLQIALIEAVGGSYTAEDELLVRLKHRAALCGADAVIGIKKSSKTRQSGDLACTDGCKRTYGATVFSGIAVVYLDVPVAAAPGGAKGAQRSPK